MKNVAHRNHLVEYYPAEETIPEFTPEYGIDSNNSEIFYKNLMTSQINKLNAPFTKHSFQNPCNTEYFPVEKLPEKIETPVKEINLDKTPTNADSGFTGSTPSG